MVDPGTNDARAEAVTRIKRKRMFQQQLAGFVFVNVVLWVIWAVTGAGFPWPIFVTVFWGFAMAMQAWTIYKGSKPITDEDIQREMGKGTEAT
jgi:2TM domain